MVTRYQDSGMITGSPEKIKYSGTTYYWYAVTHKDYLFTTASITVTPKTGSPQTVSYSRYTINQSVDVASVSGPSLNCVVSPNPARGQVQIKLELPAATDVQIVLSDMTGRVVRSQQPGNLNAGENQISLAVRDLPTGIYMLRVLAGDGGTAVKVVLE